MSYGEFFVERQGWAHWPKTLVMCRKHGSGIERRRYVPERTCKDKAKSGPYFWCDSCNQFIIYPSPPNYCPECGAKVVDE